MTLRWLIDIYCIVALFVSRQDLSRKLTLQYIDREQRQLYESDEIPSLLCEFPRLLRANFSSTHLMSRLEGMITD